ncbi:hypothetical protein T06_10534 [Trichinella sp. T6]|nr:hypothetical protein T06_10534 [Trichinella sp. T6]
MQTFLKTENLRILPKALHDQRLYLKCSQNLENYLELHIFTMCLFGLIFNPTYQCSISSKR